MKRVAMTMRGARPARRFAMLAMLPALFAAGSASAQVLPSSATPQGYSLSQLAQDTAVYNTAIVAGQTATPPSIPFQVLEGDTTVNPGTYLYLPIYFADDSGSSEPGFPSDVTDQSADASFLKSNAGVNSFIVQIDGAPITTLDDSYITGVTTAPLPDGPPAGTHYIVSAAVISPLAPGVHSIGFGGDFIPGDSPFSGDTLIGGDTVTVVPEPASMALLGLGAACALRRGSRRQQR